MALSQKQYWDEVWSKRLLPEAINPHKQNVSNYINIAFHNYFTEIFSNLDNGEIRLLEIGCAGSPWLPYFAKEFGFKVAGLDYSEIGCSQARAMLEKEKVEGEIFHADFFIHLKACWNSMMFWYLLEWLNISKILQIV